MSKSSRVGSRVLLPLIATALIVLSWGAFPATASSPPSIASDQSDYAAGSIVTLTGADWQGDNSVHVVVDDTNGRTWSRSVDVGVAADGSITDTFTLPSNFVAVYEVTATGNDTLRQATTSFTDAAISVSNTQGETATAGVPSGSYTNGDIKSYREGDFINFRFTVTNSDAAIRQGNLTIEFDDVGSGCTPEGFFVGSFGLGTHNGSHPPVENISGSSPTVTKVGGVSVNGSDWNQTINFQFNNAGSALVYFTLQLSDEAGACSGSSTHVGFSTGSQTGDVGSPGTQSWPVPAKDVIQIGDVTVIKKIDRDGNGTFESTAHAGEYKFCMADYPTSGTTTCQNTDSSGQTVFANVPDGSHAITEQQLDTTSGTYAFISGSGTGTNGGTCTFSGSTATATVVGSATKPQFATCTFNNGLVNGSIELKKTWSGTGGQTTLQIGTADGGAQVDSQQTGANGAAPLTTGPNTRTPGTYYLSETGGLGNYTSSAFTCFNDNGAGGGTANNGTKDGTEANVAVGANNSVSVTKNDDVVCSITNTRNQGKIELKKVWSGAGGQTTLNIGTTNGGHEVVQQQTGAAGAAPLTTGEQTVDTGNFFLSENGGLTDYTSSAFTCFNDNGAGGGTANNGTKDGTEANVAVGANNSVSVTKNDDVVCSITNTRNQGKIELKKVWSGAGGQTTLNIGTTNGGHEVVQQQTGAAGAAPLTTGEQTVDTGNFFLSENSGLTDYTSSAFTCFNDNGAGGGTANNGTKDGTEANVAVGANNSVSVTKNDDVVCSITNTRNQGTIEVIKDFVGTSGLVDLQVDNVDKVTDVGDNGTTGAVTVDTGNHSVGETAGTGTDLTLYTSSVICKDAQNVTVAGGNGTSLSGIAVGKNDTIVCTITNTRNQGKIELQKHWVGTAGNTTVTISQGQTTVDSAVANGADNTTGENTVDTGTFPVSETAVPNYSTDLSCFNDIGGGQGGVAGDGIRNGSEALVDSTGGDVSVATGDDVVCTFTNSRDRGAIELQKVWSGTAGQTTLQIGTSAGGHQTAQQLTGATGAAPLTTGQKNVDTGTFYLSETGGLADYTTGSFTCFNDNGGTTGTANDGIKNGDEATVSVGASDSVEITAGDDVVCTITNTRNQGKIELQKHWVGTAGNTTVTISQGQTTVDSAVANGADNTTGENTVDTGTFHVSETAVPNYSTDLSCFNDIGGGQGGVAGDGIRNGSEALVDSTGGDVSVATGDDVVCTFTNSRDRGAIELQKVWSGTAGQTTLQIGTSAGGHQTAQQLTGANGAAPLTTGQKNVDTGTFYLSETGGLADYTTGSFTCFNDNGGTTGTANDGIKNGDEATVSVGANDSVQVTTGDDVVCSITNTRNQGKIELQKHWVGTAGNTTVTISQGQTTVDSAVANGADNTTGENTVDTGTFHVSETAVPNYSTDLSCFNDIGGGQGGVAGDGIRNGSEALVDSTGGDVSVATGDDVVCTFTNSRDRGAIELQKVWSGTAGQTTLQIGTSAGGHQTAQQLTGANGAAPLTTGQKAVDTGTFFLSETGGLADYTASAFTCFNDNGGTTGNANNGVKDGDEASVSVGANDSVQVTTGDDVVCSITNTRNQGKIELQKHWVGTAGNTTVTISQGQTTVDSAVAN